MNNFNHILGMNTEAIEQGTPEWRKARAGVITGSNIDLVLMDDRLAPLPDGVEIKEVKRGVNVVAFNGQEFTGTKAECVNWYREQLPRVMQDTKKSYLNKLVAEVATGLIHENVKFKQAEWGHENEPKARENYEFRDFCTVSEAGFIYKDDSLRCGISPDGLVMDSEIGLEIKCPYTTEVHIDTLLNGEIKREYINQMQYSMWVTGFKRWDFCSFDPRMRGDSENRLHIMTLERDEALMKRFDVKVAEFVGMMDAALAKLGFKFGQQWENNNG